MINKLKELINLPRILVLIGAVLLLSYNTGDSKLTRKVSTPNIILINVDDMGWTDLGCYGSQYYETPNIDRMASEGMKFTDAYAACAVCSPSRAALLTGRYPVRHGITTWCRHPDKYPEKNPDGYQTQSSHKLLEPENHLWMELDEITVAEVLKSAGYVTCHIGKWHLGPEPWGPEKQGFDYNLGGCELGAPVTYFDPYNEKLPGFPSRQTGEYLTDREADEAVSFIRKHKDNPFFLMLNHYAVHAPLMSKDELVEKYRNKPETRQKNPVYAGMVESVDESTGKIMAVLDELHLSEKTLLIFTSDNGGVDAAANNHPHNFFTDNSPLRAGKCWPYEGGIRVPFIVRWTGIIESRSVSPIPVSGIDLFPTICEATGKELPENLQIDGTSLLPLLRDEATLHRDGLYWHFPHYQNTTPNTIIRSGDLKLIKWHEDNSYELYNLKDDVSETSNLADLMPDKVTELAKKMDAWLVETGAKLPMPK